MKIELRPIDEIKPYPGNPRLNDGAVAAVAGSLKEFGFRQPIVVDTKSVIIVGHTRYKAALKLGLKKIPVHIATDLSPAQVRAYRIADNATGAISEWDLDRLPIELSELKEMHFDMDLLGFDAEDLATIMSGSVKPGLADADEVPEPPAKAITQLGDLWVLGEHRLLCGDSTSSDDVARLMKGGSAKMMFGDPPWNVAIGLDSNPRHRQRRGLENDNLSPEKFQAFLAGFISAVQKHVLGDVYCVMGSREWPTIDQAFRDHGYHWSGTLVWVKDLFVLGRSNYHRRFEPIWYGWHGKGKSSFIADRDLNDVWEAPRPRCSADHPTMKPVELPLRAILNSSEPGDKVLDPFGGSGTTLIGAVLTGRSAYLMELDPIYCDVIVRRWERFTGNKATRESGKTPTKRTPARTGAKRKAVA